jgi:type I restriction enzyme M protein
VAAVAEYAAADTDPLGAIEAWRLLTQDLAASHAALAPGMAGSVDFHRQALAPHAEHARSLAVRIEHAVRATLRLLDIAEKQIGARDDAAWPTREIGRARKALEAARGQALDRLKRMRHFQRHAAWLIERFPDARYRDVTGLCKAVSRAEIAAADWSLTPGRYVGVAAVVEDEDFDFAETLRGIRVELEELDRLAAVVGQRVISALAKLEA